MALAPSSSGSEPVIAEVEMKNAGADQAATTVRATVVQASSVFYDTPATLGACDFALSPLSLASTHPWCYSLPPGRVVWLSGLVLRERCLLACLAKISIHLICVA